MGELPTILVLAELYCMATMTRLTKMCSPMALQPRKMELSPCPPIATRPNGKISSRKAIWFGISRPVRWRTNCCSVLNMATNSRPTAASMAHCRHQHSIWPTPFSRQSLSTCRTAALFLMSNFSRPMFRTRSASVRMSMSWPGCAMTVLT